MSSFTVVFDGNVEELSGNPFMVENPFGKMTAICNGDLVSKNECLIDALQAVVDGDPSGMELAKRALEVFCK